MLAVLEQNPGTVWQELLKSVEVSKDQHLEEEAAAPEGEPDDELSSLRI